MSVILRRLWIQISADRKRFGIFCAAFLVLLLFWARLIVVSQAPRVVMAEEDEQVNTASTDVEKVSDKPVAPPIDIELDQIPNRDPFLINAEHFPVIAQVPVFDPEQGKLGVKPTEDPEQAALRRTAELQSLASQFTLQGVLNQPPMAVVNGNLYRPGDWITSVDQEQIRFEVKSIEQRKVTIECEGRQFTLEMTTPGG